jgi:hypothetical protein
MKLINFHCKDKTSLSCQITIYHCNKCFPEKGGHYNKSTASDFSWSPTNNDNKEVLVRKNKSCLKHPWDNKGYAILRLSENGKYPAEID